MYRDIERGCSCVIQLDEEHKTFLFNGELFRVNPLVLGTHNELLDMARQYHNAHCPSNKSMQPTPRPGAGIDPRCRKSRRERI